MKLGGFCPLPWKLGGGVPPVQTLFESLNQARGSAYDTTDESNVTAETMAHARALEMVWSANRRLAHAADPKRMPAELIPRWEKILGIHPAVGDTDVARRRALHAKFLAFIGPAALQDLVVALIGDSFIAIEFTSIANAYKRWPENGFPDDWISNTAHVVIRVDRDASDTNAEFWRMKSLLRRTLRDFLPAWTTIDIAIESTGNGFFLDEPNLNLETFRI